ncbi:2-oxo acid dehydrogenase subunit E2 [Limibaculum sp. FT325]|uniref:dihydrolipoamide acetyltransferase family protein n=1 Tax=Thermohalobaculum sediminis TaxID=2939436 RepID=UPI0020BFEB3D|nr:dihydrolipoamide acetyltransferase family protein [Limibaculum sediminis]MCL5778299.1 2-oxo acid dehydrogenase subunit E2 [Limibaculum sediminis]
MGVFAMPSLGADMEAGKLVEWLIAPGDRVNRGDVIAVVETQKGAIEIECFEAGVVERLDAAIGATLPVGTPMALIRGDGEAAAGPASAEPGAHPEARESVVPATAGRSAATAHEGPAPTRPAPEAAAAPRPPMPVPVAGAPQPSLPAAGAPPSSPAARARAVELGIALGTVRGSGPGGSILIADVEAAARSAEASASAAPSAEPAGTPASRPGKPGLDLGAMRAAIAAAMSRSKREIPHYYLSQTIDLQAATDWLAARNAARPPAERLLMGALFVKAAALAAREVPEVNGHHEGGAFRPATAVHAGVAVAMRGGGLIAPAIRDADQLSLDALMAAMRDLVERVRAGRLRGSEMTDGTVTVSSLGERGADSLTGVIYPPQVALVGFGTPARRPWVMGDSVVPRTLVTVTLAADHRASDGRQGARFLAGIDRLMQDPEGL